MADVDLNRFIPVFADLGVSVAFLVPTLTGYEKSIMDATAPVRELLLNSHIHDYDAQGQGQENKVMLPAYFVTKYGVIESAASLYRPVTKNGDPRIWFTNLRKYCKPYNLLAVVIKNKALYVINLSDDEISEALLSKQYPYIVLEESAYQEAEIANELLSKLRLIHKQGFLPTITFGDPGVGDTLEHALGISRNNAKTPDYKGIELKTTRLTKNGEKRTATRSTLFTKVPDEGLTYREIVKQFGKYQTPKGSTEARLQLYDTFRCSKPNAYDMILDVDSNKDCLNLFYDGEIRKYVSAWHLRALREALLTKHHETFWIKAASENINGIEHFRYDIVLHTKNPNASLIAPLLATDKITLDLAAHFNTDGSWRDHGVLFKMKPNDLPLLLGNPIEYIL